jgi:uncharacterized protein YcfL
MKPLPLISLLLLCAVSLACSNSTNSSRQPNETANYVFLSRNLAESLNVVQFADSMQSSGLLSAQLLVRNSTSGPVEFEYRAKFFDAANREVRTTFSQWKWHTIHTGSTGALDTVAPDASVVRVKFELRSKSTETKIRPERED